MRTEDFRRWLLVRQTRKSVSDSLSRCRRVEKSLQIDLDEEYQKDRGKQLLSRMEYTAADERNNRPAPLGFEFAANLSIISRLRDLRCAVKRYFKFCSVSQASCR